jgi:hypothetical protein
MLQVKKTADFSAAKLRALCSQKDSVLHVMQAWRDHVGVTTVEKPVPKGLPTFRKCTEFPPRR